MASINKIQIGNSIVHDITPSPDAQLVEFTSYDTSEPEKGIYSVINATDVASVIYAKVTSFISYLRYMINNIDSISNIIHTHDINTSISGELSIDRLPATNIQIESSSYIPTSALIYNLNQNVDNLGLYTTAGKDIFVNINCGSAIIELSYFRSVDSLSTILKDILGYQEYHYRKIDEWNTPDDVRNFLVNRFGEDGTTEPFNYGMKIGNYVTINDGTYNNDWFIINFFEGTGIGLIPRTNLCTHRWDSEAVPYSESEIHEFLNIEVYNNLYNALGDYIAIRDVTLGSELNGEGIPHGGTMPATKLTSASVETKAYLTLLTPGELGLDSLSDDDYDLAHSYNNEYDDGEVEHMLYLFAYSYDYETRKKIYFMSAKEYANGESFHLRNVYGQDDSGFKTFAITGEGKVSSSIAPIGTELGVRPLLYVWYPQPQEPSDEYEDKHIGTWNSKDDVDAFFTEHTAFNGWKDLKVGNYITINDGTYNVDWVIAGFNWEAPIDVQSESDCYGIMFIPRYVDIGETHYWHHDNTVATPYASSDIHAYINGEMKDNLYTILGDHMVNRYTELGCSCDEEGYTDDCRVTASYLTLMTPYQLGIYDGSVFTGEYDDGEACYCLRLFDSSYGEGNYITAKTYYGSGIYPWFRNVLALEPDTNIFYAFALTDQEGGEEAPFNYIWYYTVTDNRGVRPLIYLR